jgi:hypothetical protein
MSDDKFFNFKIDASDYLGIAHEEFKTNMLQLALTEPTKYFELRKTVLANVKRAAVQGQYEVYYNLLTTGSKVGDANPGSVVGTGSGFEPSIPRQKVNEFALKAAKTIDHIAEEAIEMILPMNYKKISDERTMQHTAGTLGFATKKFLEPKEEEGLM